MSGINKVILVGNVGKDPEVRHLDGGATVAKFPLATSESYKKADGTKVENTEWHNIVMWRGLAEIAEKYVRKGNLVCIEGKIKTRNWEDNGVKKYFTEIIADDMTFLGRKPDDAQAAATPTNDIAKTNIEAPAPVEPVAEPVPGDDLPF